MFPSSSRSLQVHQNLSQNSIKMASPNTKDDKQMAAALAIRSAASTVSGFSSSLEEAIECLSNSGTSQARRNRAARALKLVQINSKALAAALVENVKILDPIPGLCCVHQRKKQPLKLDTSADKENIAPKSKKPRQTKATLPAAVALPTPKDGKQLSKLELIEFLAPLGKGSKACTIARSKIIQAGLIPVQRRQVERLMDGFEKEGKNFAGLNKNWGETGREPLVTISDVTEIARKSLHDNPGHCLEQSSIKAAIVEKRKETMLAKGIQPLNDQAIAPSEASLRNYKALIAAEPGVSIIRTATVKSHT